MRIDFPLEEFDPAAVLETCRRALRKGRHVQVWCLFESADPAEKQRAIDLLEQVARGLGSTGEVLNRPRLVEGGAKLWLLSARRVGSARKEWKRLHAQVRGRLLQRLRGRERGRRWVTKVRLHLDLEEYQIAEHRERARRDLEQGRSVRFVCVLRSQGSAERDRGRVLLQRLAQELAGVGAVETGVSGEGMRLVMVLAPLSQG